MSVGLQVADLAVRHPARPHDLVVGPVSFQIEQGSALGISGETGAGKTLTLRALMGLLPFPFSMEGTIQIGSDTTPLHGGSALRAELGRRVGVVLQDPFSAFDPLKSIGSQIVEGVVRHGLLSGGEARERARTLLANTGFGQPERVMRLFPSELSGGMAQRIAIATAVMPNPAVLLADEPTSALDATLRIGVLELLDQFTKRNQGVLVLVSHDLRLISRFCQGIIVLYGGRVVETGPADKVLGRPDHPYTRALIESTPVIRAERPRRLVGAFGKVASSVFGESGCRYAPRCPFAMDICSQKAPKLELVEGKAVACYLVSRAGARRE